MKAQILRGIAGASAAVMMVSCAAPGGGYGSGYGGGGYGGGNGIDGPRTAALVAAGVAGLSLYHYNRKKNDYEREKRRNNYSYRNDRRNYRRDRWDDRRDRRYYRDDRRRW